MRHPSSSPHPQIALWWIRCDLRLEDNQTLAAALSITERVIPVFVLDPVLLHGRSRAEKREAFLLASLRQLDHDLRARGSRLILRHGRPEEALATLVAETGANVVFAERDFSPYAKRRDKMVASSIPLELVPGKTIHPPEALRKTDGSARRKFTPFRLAWQDLPLPTIRDFPSESIRFQSPGDLACFPIPEAAAPAWFPAGEVEAQRRLTAFVSGDHASVHHYAEARNRLDTDGSSSLSPYLRFGMLSPLRAFSAARQRLLEAPDAQARRGVEAWITQLIWRDFYLHSLDASPEMLHRPLRPGYEYISWETNGAGLAAWQSGQTGYPIVDAAMRQFLQVGWMPNRARMIVASFLTKDLLVDWRLGQEWFMRHLVDGDPAANAGGWQWVSGAGTDGVPYFRMFNPILQAKKFDPMGDYIKRWIPELHGVPRAHVHQPWRMPIEVQRESGCVIGRDYPEPIVDHAQARIRALSAIKAAISDRRMVQSI
jgi:deoxyribodipyrimidine photo-lyase